MQEGILLFYLPCNPSMEQELKKKKKLDHNYKEAYLPHLLVIGKTGFTLQLKALPPRPQFNQFSGYQF